MVYGVWGVSYASCVRCVRVLRTMCALRGLQAFSVLVCCTMQRLGHTCPVETFSELFCSYSCISVYGQTSYSAGKSFALD